MQKALGTRLDLSTAHHPKTDGQSKKTIQTLKDMLCCYILDLGGNWDDHLPLVKFTYNKSYYANVGVAPYEYGRLDRSLLCWAEPKQHVVIGPQVIDETTEKVRAI